MVRVKICGITNLEDAAHAVTCGADALGFIFHKKSPRYIDPVEAGKIIKELPPFATTVGVFVDLDKSEVRDIILKSGVRVLQFHGSEPPDFCRSFGVKYIKAFRVKDMDCLSGLSDYPDAAAYLLDAYSEKEYGGTGMTFNWDAAVYAKKAGRIILAGGLTPENVAEAVAKVRPYAVDVSSGVEATKGRKNPAAVEEFIKRAKGVI